jgi:hypothetical protein
MTEPQTATVADTFKVPSTRRVRRTVLSAQNTYTKVQNELCWHPGNVLDAENACNTWLSKLLHLSTLVAHSLQFEKVGANGSAVQRNDVVQLSGNDTYDRSLSNRPLETNNQPGASEVHNENLLETPLLTRHTRCAHPPSSTQITWVCSPNYPKV